MDDESMRWLVDRPDLSDPVMIVMLSGWIDAGMSAGAAMEAIETESEASPIAQFDDDVFIDFRARRPIMELREGLHSVLRWERILVSVGHDQTGRDIVLLTGPEPDMSWHRFTRLVGELAVELGVRRMVHLGAYPFAVPHTRPCRLSVSSPSHDVLSKVPFLRSSIDVPAGVAAALEREMHERGIPALGIWVQVPHYISGMSYPAASVALIEGIHEAADILIDATNLRAEVMLRARRLDALVEGNDDHAKMISQLEQIYDATDGSVETHSDGTDSAALEMRSGDELAAELEKFLRDQD